MFESAELHRTMTRAELEAELPEIRSRLLAAQRALRNTKHSVIIIVSGVEGAGKSQVVNRLHVWLDARGLSAHAFWRDSDEERERPRYWRFWRTLPPRGTIGILFGSWYTAPIIDRVFRRSSRADLDAEIRRIAFFEHMLAQDDAVIIKLWFHLPRKEQEGRVRETKKHKKRTSRYGPVPKEFTRLYDRFAASSERVIRMTDTADAPWHIIEATDDRYRDLTAARILLERLEELARREPASASASAASSSSSSSSMAVVAHADEQPAVAAEGPTVLDQVDLQTKIDPDKYVRQLSALQGKLGRLAWKAWNAGRSAVVIFEGWDAAGKGGAIRRLIAPMDARIYRVISVAAPTDEERAQHYLWRFWRRIPRAGAMTIYDRSWYGRVLVERVEGFANVEEWARAYREINDFEEQLVESGIVLVKFWLHIDQDEQLRRFEERRKIAFKQHKITDEDWRNRAKWDPYRLAVHDMVSHTSSAVAPWTLIAANDKHTSRVEVLRTVVQRLDEAL